MTWLLLDAGNTALKWALADPEQPRLLAEGSVALKEGFADSGPAWEAWNEALRAALAALPAQGPAPVALGCSVASESTVAAIGAAVRRCLGVEPQWVAAQQRFEFRGVFLESGYEEPLQLGADRWHAMIGARQGRPDCALVVVCAGTATTVDWIDAAGRFLGGVIAPGPALMAGSLAGGTARLPLAGGRVVEAPGNTEDAIATGLADCTAGLVERRVFGLAQRGGPIRVLLTGGHAAQLGPRLRLAREVSGIGTDIDVEVSAGLILRGLWLRAAQRCCAEGLRTDR